MKTKNMSVLAMSAVTAGALGAAVLAPATAASAAAQAAPSPAAAAAGPAPGVRVVNVTSPTQIPSNGPDSGTKPASTARPDQVYHATSIQNAAAGLCLGINPEQPQYDGNPVGLWECTAQDAFHDQDWWWAPVANMPVGYYTIQNGGTLPGAPVGLCLDGDTSTIPSNGTKVQLWSCNGQTNQDWLWTGSTLRNVDGNECLSAVTPSDEAPVQLWSCDGATNQNWSPVFARIGN